MKTRALRNLVCISLMAMLTSCSKQVHGISLNWIVVPLAIIVIVAIGIVVLKNYRSMAEEKKLIEEMARREKMFAAEEAERQKQLAAQEAQQNKQP